MGLIRDRFARGRPYVVLFLTILVAVAVAGAWAVRVPIFQEPDELAHADYAFALFDAGQPFDVSDARLATTASSQAAYLSGAVRYREMRYNPYAHVTPAYGSRSYFAALDARAPVPSGRPPPPHAALPYVVALYPIGYYALEATAMAIADRANRSLTGAFFAARLLNVAMLGVTLALGFTIFRRSGLAVREAIFATAAVGFFPMVAWVAGYVQPDNLVACLFAAGIATALRTPSGRGSLAAIALAGAIVSATVLVKVHYALALWLAVGPLLASRVPAARRLLGTCLFVAFDVVLPLVTYQLSVTVLNPVRHLISPTAWVAAAHAGHGSQASAVAGIASAALHAFEDAFFGGVASLGFWLHFGMRSGTFVPDDAVAPVRDVIVAATVVTLGLFVVLECVLARRVFRVARRRSVVSALRLALAAAPVNAYAIVTAMLIAIGAVTRGGLVIQGRYWLPVVTSLAVVLFVHLPKLARAGRRRRIQLTLTSGAAAYSFGAALLALGAMNANFYGWPTRPLAHDSVADIETVRTARSTLADIDNPTVHRGDTLFLSGYAVDMRTGLPAGTVTLSIDGRDCGTARVGRPVRRLATTFNDDAILRSGFDFRIPARAVDAGTHDLRFYVATEGTPGRLAFRREIHLHVI